MLKVKGLAKEEDEKRKIWRTEGLGAAGCYISQPSTWQLVIVQILGTYYVPAAPHVLFFTYQKNLAKWFLFSFYRWKVES